MGLQLPAGDAQVGTQPGRMAVTAAVPLDVLVGFLASTHPGKRRGRDWRGGRKKKVCLNLRLYSQIHSETGTRNVFVGQRSFRFLTILDDNSLFLNINIYLYLSIKYQSINWKECSEGEWHLKIVKSKKHSKEATCVCKGCTAFKFFFRLLTAYMKPTTSSDSICISICKTYTTHINQPWQQEIMSAPCSLTNLVKILCVLDMYLYFRRKCKETKCFMATIPHTDFQTLLSF